MNSSEDILSKNILHYLLLCDLLYRNYKGTQQTLAGWIFPLPLIMVVGVCLQTSHKVATVCFVFSQLMRHCWTFNATNQQSFPLVLFVTILCR